MTYYLITTHPRISWKYEDIDDIVSVDNATLTNVVNIYTVRDSINRFNINNLFKGKRSILKPFIRAYIKIIEKGFEPRLFLVTNRKIDKDAAQLFFRIERLRMNDISLLKFRREGGKQTKEFMEKLDEIICYHSKKSRIKIQAEDLLKTIYRPQVVDKEDAPRIIKKFLETMGEINHDDIEDKYKILLQSIAHVKICTIEWVDSILKSHLMDTLSPVDRQQIRTPMVSIHDLRKMKLGDSIIRTEELQTAKVILEQIDLHIKCGGLYSKSPSLYIFERATNELDSAWKKADGADGKYMVAKKNLTLLLQGRDKR